MEINTTAPCLPKWASVKAHVSSFTHLSTKGWYAKAGQFFIFLDKVRCLIQSDGLYNLLTQPLLECHGRMDSPLDFLGPMTGCDQIHQFGQAQANGTSVTQMFA